MIKNKCLKQNYLAKLNSFDWIFPGSKLILFFAIWIYSDSYASKFCGLKTDFNNFMLSSIGAFGCGSLLAAL